MKVLLLLAFSLITTLSAHSASQPLPWRGVMIDVSRHFLPLEDLEKQVDAMSHFGLNILHLHLTDAAGWRLFIPSLPRLTEVGAWRTHAQWKQWWTGDRGYGGPYGGYYTTAEITHLVEYARQRGVTIVPEIEFPAHSEEAIAAYPFLGYNHAEMDMQSDSVYAFMEQVLTHVASLFPGPYIHVGGDEAATQRALQPQAMRRIHRMVRQLGRRMVVWDECADADTGLVVMVWRDMERARRAAEKGNQVVLCPGKWLYLDKAQDCPATEPEASGGYLPIDSIYQLPLHEADEFRSQLLGLQANLWTEYVPSVPHLEHMLWPRAVAVARMANGQGASRKAHLKALRWLRSHGFHPFPLDSAVGQRPQSLRPIKHLASGARVIYHRPFHPLYAAGGETALTDGRQGTWDNADGRWQGFINGGLFVTLDLGATQSIGHVEISFLQTSAPEIFLPAHWLLTASTDGEHFTTLTEESLTADTAHYSIRTLQWKSSPRPIRYLRVQATPGERGGWLFADEVVVRER